MAGENVVPTIFVEKRLHMKYSLASMEALGVQELIMEFPIATDLTILDRFAQEFIV